MIENLNIRLFEFVNQFAGRSVILDKIGVIFAKYLIFIFIAILILMFFKKNYRGISLYSAYSAVLGVLINFTISIFYFHPRPFALNLGTKLIEHVPDASFPSDHTTFMLSIAFMLLYFKKTRKTGIILSLFGLIGGIARIFTGVHFPFDILGSIATAGISSYIIFLSRKRLSKVNEYALK